ncbi:hypothetical protein IJ096_01700 [Candidatus Saccharibacteria bacterium]|nr:hypothetical protein [Candidatus Saccharibacteria bacterium]
MSKKLNLLIITGTVIALGAGIVTTLHNDSQATSQNITITTDSENTNDSTSALVDETVYVFTDASGKTRRVISSDWTKTTLDTDKYTKIENNTQETPINVAIKYTLDGKEISATDLSGKSGKVTIEYTYTNNEIINGYYMPYAVMSGLILDNANFKNITVDNGRLINDGSRTVIAGVMLPGLQENLGLNSAFLNLPTTLKITADVTNFKLGMTMSVATSSIFQELDTSKLSTIDELQGQLTLLQDGMNQLISGSSQLFNGLTELNDKSGILVSGINKLTAGSTELTNGLISADSGVSTLQEGATSLNDALAQLSNSDITTPAYATFNALLQGTHSTIQNQIYLSTYQQFVALGITDQNFISTVLQEKTIPEFTADNYQLILDNLIAQATASGDTTTAATLTQTKASLVSYQTEYLPGLAQYTGAISQIYNSVNSTLLPGIATLKEGTSALSAGATTLTEGLTELKSATPTLTSGIAQLKDGSNSLYQGLQKFNAEGIQSLVSAAGSLSILKDRLTTTINLSKTYHPQTKFIYRTDEIK